MLFYSADIVFSPELLRHVVHDRHCKYIFHDCQWNGPGVVHATLDELLTLPDELQERIFLMHYGDDMDLTAPVGKMTIVEQHRVYELK
jgi:hydroxyacylglutathione hydrolase